MIKINYRIDEFLKYLEKHNKASPNSEILDHKILFSLHDELYNKIDNTEYLGIRYTELIPVLIKAIQELNEKLQRNNIN